MVRLRGLDIDEGGSGRETVSILVGPNGSGKSRLLLEIAERYRFERNVTIICNTPHDRFVGLRRPKRLSAPAARCAVGKATNSPRWLKLVAIILTLMKGSRERGANRLQWQARKQRR